MLQQHPSQGWRLQGRIGFQKGHRPVGLHERVDPADLTGPLRLEAFGQIADPALQRLSDLSQSRKAHPVRTELVFLDLLKRDAERRGQSLLGDAKCASTLTDAAPDSDIELVRTIHG